MFANGTVINQGATVFIGEQGLNLTHALNGAYIGSTCGNILDCGDYYYCERLDTQPPAGIESPSYFDHYVTDPSYCPPGYFAYPEENVAPILTQIGWWASAANIFDTAPSKTIDLSTRYTNFMVAPSDFVGYTGNWYLLDTNGRAYSLPAPLQSNDMCKCTSSSCVASLVFTVVDPSLDIRIWDYTTNNDVTGKSVPQGEKLGFRIDTNMYPAVNRNFRNNAIESCWEPNQLWWNGTVNVTDCWACGKFHDQVVNISYVVSGDNWQTWMSAPNACSSLNTTPLYWYDGHVYGGYPNPAPVTPGWYQDYGYTLSGWVSNNPNLETVVGDPGDTHWWYTDPLCDGSDNLDPAIDGYIDLKVKDEGNAQLNALYNQSVGEGVLLAGPHSVLKNFVNTQPFFWGAADGSSPYFNWNTGALDIFNQYAYPVGTYTISAESTLNKMKANYKQGGADYTGKTVSQSYTITLVSDTVKIDVNKDSVVRSKTFSVTVTGRPATQYYLWVKGTSTLDGSYDNQPPLMVYNQQAVQNDKSTTTSATPPYAGYSTDAASVACNGDGRCIGDFQYENGARASILDDVSKNYFTDWGTREYALITTDTSGVRTIEFMTTNWTKAQKYTIRVEQRFPITTRTDYYNGSYKNDEVDVKVEKGAVTIVAAGDQSYYLGEEIKFSGTNTETYKTYLFIVGPNLPDNGANIAKDDPRHWPTATNDVTTFKVVDVNGDNTWSWKWGTANYALDAGTYTVYAVSQPSNKGSLENAAYGTVSIIIKKPFISATASQSTVAKGDRIFITGVAEGNPDSVQIWILGKNFYTKATESVNSDASFSYEVTQDTTKKLASGQYFVVAQHPMQNTKFDIDTIPGGALNQDSQNNDLWVYNLQLTDTTTGAPTKIFKLGGAGSLQGSDAAEALVEGINDANVDDTYTKLQFLVEEPVIRIDSIGDKHVGDKFTITAQTNLAVDDEVLVQVYSSSFKPTDKSQSGEFSGATGTVKVTKGDNGMNKISFDIDSSTFKPDEYIVTAQAVIQDNAVGTALFNVLETPVVTATPVVAVTTAAPATVPPTTVVTTVPTPVPTTKSPGYGALIALIGLGAVAFIVVRRH
jgi:PGF-CTERM protein